METLGEHFPGCAYVIISTLRPWLICLLKRIRPTHSPATNYAGSKCQPCPACAQEERGTQDDSAAGGGGKWRKHTRTLNCFCVLFLSPPGDYGRFSICRLGKSELASLLVLTSKLSSGVGTSEKGRSQVAVALDWNSTCSSLLADVLFSACPLWMLSEQIYKLSAR